MTTKRKAKAKPVEEFIKDPAPEEVSVIPAEAMSYEDLLKENVQLYNELVDMRKIVQTIRAENDQKEELIEQLKLRINDLGNSIINKFLKEYRNG